MESNSTNSPTLQSEAVPTAELLDDWFDPIEAGLRDRVREFIQELIEGELEAALARPRYGRRAKPAERDGEEPSGATGYRHGHRSRSLLGTFGRVVISVPRLDWTPPSVRQPSGRARRCGLTNGEPSGPIR